MSTTELFVELIIIGTGAIIWIGFLIGSLFDLSQVNLDYLSSLTALIPFVSFTYVIGIVVDRLADVIFERVWAKKIFERYYKDKEDYYNDRRTLYIHEGRLADLLEYGRSRLRICRGWAVNSVLVLIFLNIYVWSRVPGAGLKAKVSLFGTICFAMLAFGTWFSWYRITLSNYRKIKEQSLFLRHLKYVQEKVDAKKYPPEGARAGEGGSEPLGSKLP